MAEGIQKDKIEWIREDKKCLQELEKGEVRAIYRRGEKSMCHLLS